RVVHPVADHGDRAALALQFGDLVDLLAGQHLGVDPVDADLGGDLAGDRGVVAGQQHRLQAQAVEVLDRLGAGRLDGVGDRDDPGDLPVPAGDDAGASGGLVGGLDRGELGRHLGAGLGVQGVAADGDLAAVDG